MEKNNCVHADFTLNFSTNYIYFTNISFQKILVISKVKEKKVKHYLHELC